MTHSEMTRRYWDTFNRLTDILGAVERGKLTEAERQELRQQKFATKRALEFAESKLERVAAPDAEPGKVGT